MALIDVKWAELHTSLFHCGKNFGLKLDPAKITGLKLLYDKEQKELLVVWTDQTMHVPSTSVQCYLPGSPVAPKSSMTVPLGVVKTTAQIETPQSHVHAGSGAGKTRS